MIAKVVQQTFTGDLASRKLGDWIINNVALFDDSGTKVGAGGAVCTIVSIQDSPPDTPVQCLFSAVFDKGQIVFGGLAPFPEPGAVGPLVVLSNGDIDNIIDLE